MGYIVKPSREDDYEGWAKYWADLSAERWAERREAARDLASNFEQSADSGGARTSHNSGLWKVGLLAIVFWFVWQGVSALIRMILGINHSILLGVAIATVVGMLFWERSRELALEIIGWAVIVCVLVFLYVHL
jgi:hypothetical protein